MVPCAGVTISATEAVWSQVISQFIVYVTLDHFLYGGGEWSSVLPTIMAALGYGFIVY